MQRNPRLPAAFMIVAFVIALLVFQLSALTYRSVTRPDFYTARLVTYNVYDDMHAYIIRRMDEQGERSLVQTVLTGVLKRYITPEWVTAQIDEVIFDALQYIRNETEEIPSIRYAVLAERIREDTERGVEALGLGGILGELAKSLTRRTIEGAVTMGLSEAPLSPEWVHANGQAYREALQSLRQGFLWLSRLRYLSLSLLVLIIVFLWRLAKGRTSVRRDLAAAFFLAGISAVLIGWLVPGWMEPRVVHRMEAVLEQMPSFTPFIAGLLNDMQGHVLKLGFVNVLLAAAMSIPGLVFSKRVKR